MNRSKIAGTLTALTIILAVILAGCGSPGVVPSPTPPPEPVQDAVSTFSAETGTSMDAISIISFDQTEWPNACLGLAEEGEMCAQVITEGWQIMVNAGGQEYEIRADMQASIVRFQAGGEASNPDSLY